MAKGKETKFIRAPWLRDNWSPRLSKAGIDLMLCGHTHVYAELPPDANRTYPILVGGTETMIRVDVTPERLQMTAFKDNGADLALSTRFSIVPPLVTRALPASEELHSYFDARLVRRAKTNVTSAPIASPTIGYL